MRTAGSLPLESICVFKFGRSIGTCERRCLLSGTNEVRGVFLAGLEDERSRIESERTLGMVENRWERSTETVWAFVG